MACPPVWLRLAWSQDFLFLAQSTRLKSISPRPPRRVPHVDDFNCAVVDDSVKYLITIALQHLHANFWITGLPRRVRAAQQSGVCRRKWRAPRWLHHLDFAVRGNVESRQCLRVLVLDI